MTYGKALSAPARHCPAVVQSLADTAAACLHFWQF
jgi:hypothetical protein